ncbi:MAG: precorrin-8X methylmutase [Desulfuromonadales bacterium]|nr:precorrin-8X methylmutase [Desulfuromonadales bacterium]
MSVHLRPEEIEAESFRIIDSEAGAHGWSAAEWPIVRRAVHTSADFDYVRDLVIAPTALAKGITALRRGRTIVTDTRMAKAGITAARLDPFGIEVRCLVDDPVVAKSAKRLGVTRSLLAMRTAVQVEDAGIFVIGNAPTALFELLRLIREEGVRPDLIVGLPVGFVGAAESKAELLAMAADYQLPMITNRGRKGGSNVAAAVVNALLILAAGSGD